MFGDTLLWGARRVAMCAHVFASVKELNEVGTNLAKKVGDLQINREKNRYPYILPCKCDAHYTTAGYAECVTMPEFCLPASLFPTTSARRRPLPGAAVCSALPAAHRLHQRKLCACECQFISSLLLGFPDAPPLFLSFMLMIPLFAFRVEAQKETSSAPRVLCATP